MAWITPKTDWLPTDYINTEDYSRILGNLKYLADLFNIAVQEYQTQNISDLPYPNKWNIAEDNLEEINQLTYEFEIGAKKQFMVNQTNSANADVMGNRLAFELGEERGEYND